MPAATSSILIRASPDQVMATLTDFAAYPRFLPDIREARVLHRPGPDAWEVRFTLQVIRRLEYNLLLTRRDALHLDWTLTEGVFRANDGGWSLEPRPDGATRATYRIDLQLGMFVPGNIIHSLVDRGLPQTLERFRDEVQRRGAPEGTDPAGG